jgi:hypothetical protein
VPALTNFSFNKVKDLWDEPLDDLDDMEEETTETTPELATTRRLRGFRQTLYDLYTTLEGSEDKVCFIAHQPDGQTIERWFLIQVDLDRMDPVAAKQQGVYWVHWMIRHYKDCLKQTIQECRYWPEVHERTQDPMNPYGRIIPVRPGKHTSILRQGNRILYKGEIDLASKLIHRPTNFGPGGSHKMARTK